jgi:hypothetical protein
MLATWPAFKVGDQFVFVEREIVHDVEPPHQSTNLGETDALACLVPSAVGDDSCP